MAKRVIPGRPASRPDWKQLTPKPQRAQPPQQPHLEVNNIGDFPLDRDPATVYAYRFPFPGKITHPQLYVDELPEQSKVIAQVTYNDQTVSIPVFPGSNAMGDAPMDVEDWAKVEVRLSTVNDHVVWAKGIMVSFLYYPTVSV